MGIWRTSATFGGANPALVEDRALLPRVVEAVTAAGARMVERFPDRADFVTRDDVVAAIYANDDASLALLRPRCSPASARARGGSRTSSRAACSARASGGSPTRSRATSTMRTA